MGSIYAKVYIKTEDTMNYIRTCGGSNFWVEMCKNEIGLYDMKRRIIFLSNKLPSLIKFPGNYNAKVICKVYRKNRNCSKHLKYIYEYNFKFKYSEDKKLFIDSYYMEVTVLCFQKGT